MVTLLVGSDDQKQTVIASASENFFTLLSKRRQQMAEIVGDEISEAEKRMNQIFALASANLALAAMSIAYPPLIWLSLPISVYCSIPVYQLAYKVTVKDRKVSAYFLDTLLVTGMFLGGFYSLIAIDLWFFLLAENLLLKSEHNSKKKITNLFGVPPRSVWVLTADGIEIELPFEKLQRGDIIIVSAGQMIPVDGVITSGFASIDQHKLTGESQPIEKGVGDEVLASTVVLAGRIGIRTAKTGEETVAMQIGKILEQTADFKNSLQSRGESITDQLVLPTLGLSALFWPIFGFSSAIAVLTNEFGYKMRLLAPASMLTFLNIASEQGVLIKDGRSLELLNQVDTVVFDKTGTLTMEQPTVGQLHMYHGVCEDELLTYAAAAEDGQTHPIAKAILAAASERELVWPKMIDANYEMGHGIQVSLPDRIVRVGSDKFMAINAIAIPNAVKAVQTACHEHGHSLVLVAFDATIVGAIELHATIRPEAQAVIEQLRQRNMSMYIISGDHEAPTRKLAQTLGINHYFANILPEDKAALVTKLQAEGKAVCFVGDGINDSIALKRANVSISLRGATTIATDSAQVVLMDGSLSKLNTMFDIAAELTTNMKTNLYISTIPCGISIGGIVLFHWGVAAGIAISTSAMFMGIANSVAPLLKQHHTNPLIDITKD
ncbi:MAG: heavy metal translocating P-type ATPase [Caldilineaceae bacterium]